MNQNLRLPKDNLKDFMLHLKSRYSLFHLSNVFFRDIHYGIMSYLEAKGVKLGYGQAEQLASQFVLELEKSNVLKAIKTGSWMLNYPEFRKLPAEPAASAKPAPVTPRPAAMGAETQSASLTSSKPPVSGPS
jgi:hypothetical protein